MTQLIDLWTRGSHYISRQTQGGEVLLFRLIVVCLHAVTQDEMFELR